MKVCSIIKNSTPFLSFHLLLPSSQPGTGQWNNQRSKHQATKQQDPHQGNKGADKHTTLWYIYRIHWLEWFNSHVISIWTWSEAQQQDIRQVSVAVKHHLNLHRHPRWSSIRCHTGHLMASSFTGPPWMMLIIFMRRLTPNQNHPCYTCSGYNSEDQFAAKLSTSFSICKSASEDFI